MVRYFDDSFGGEVKDGILELSDFGRFGIGWLMVNTCESFFEDLADIANNFTSLTM